VRAKGKSCEQNGTMKLLVEPIQRNPHILLLAMAAVMFSLTAAGAAEIKSQYRESEAVQGLHGAVHDLVMHCAATLGMRMAYQGAVARVTAALVQKGFQRTGWSSQVKGPDVGRIRHWIP
jgi:hypothetical protein